MRQKIGSNDCGIFTLIIYTKYLKMRPTLTENIMINLKNIKYNVRSSYFGQIGRTNIAESLMNQKINFESESVNTLQINVGKKYTTSFN